MVGLFLIILLIILALLIAPFIFWILKVIRLSKNKDKTGMWVVLLCGIFLSPFIGWLVGFAYKEDDADKDKKGGDFWCGICNIKFPEDFLGGETIYEGKICRSCLGKKQRGETITPPTENQPKATHNESLFTMNRDPRPKTKDRSSSERRILLRELNRKQRKRSSYLTQFIINLAIVQWLLPLITILIFWVQLKEQMKVQSLNSSGLGLPAEIPFKSVIKDLFKMLTSEFYTYGGHNIQISVLWKIGIVLAFLVPLGLWIYNLIRFFSVKGEVERLESEIKELDN